jgi:hypothetical protein
MSDAPHLQYPLQAWIEGHYARDCNEPATKCPYENGSTMAVSWLKGWLCRDESNTARVPPQRTKDAQSQSA